MEYGGAIGRHAGGKKHVAQLRAGRIGDHPLNVVLEKRDRGRKKGGRRTDNCNNIKRDRGMLKKRRAAANKKHAGRDHCRGMNEGRDGSGPFHRGELFVHEATASRADDLSSGKLR